MMTLYGSLDTWLLIGFLALGAWGLTEIITAFIEWRVSRVSPPSRGWASVSRRSSVMNPTPKARGFSGTSVTRKARAAGVGPVSRRTKA